MSVTAASRTTLTMANGAGIDLLDPTPRDIDFAVIAEHLAKANRYCGATPGIAYSVAEHSVRCADAALKETHDETLAAYLLCHDMHEAYLGDDTTPKKRALATIIQSFGVLADSVERSFTELTDRFDKAIHAKAGLTWPPKQCAAAIHKYDRILLATEWRDLMGYAEPYPFHALPLPERIEPMDWQSARDLFYDRCSDLLPKLKEEAA